MMKKKSIYYYVSFILITFLVGISSSWVTQPEISSWYSNLIKPSFNPPNYLFGPVWTLLYLMMASAAFLVWSQNSKKRKTALSLYFIQLILNGLWSWIFFKFHMIGIALIEIILLWILIIITIIAFWKVKKEAAYLMIPYLLWVSFAAILNTSLWRLNS